MSKHIKRLLHFVFLAPIVVLVACGGGGGSPPNPTPAPTISSVSVSPSSGTLSTGTTEQLNATVTGTGNYDATVSWSVCDGTRANCVTGGNSSHGTISSTGLYTAPTLQTGSPALVVTVQAAANGDTSKSASIILTITSFTNASLNGQYAFALRSPVGEFSVAGSFAADGNGNLTQGILDYNYGSYMVSGISGSDGSGVPFTGTYQLNSDGRGLVTLVLSSAPATQVPSQYALVMVSSTEGKIICTNLPASSTTASGVLLKQDTSAFSNGAIAGNYLIRYAGLMSGWGNCEGGPLSFPASQFGLLTLDGQGAISNGSYMLYCGGSEGASGSYSVGSNGRGTISFSVTDGSIPQTLSIYVVSGSRILLISSDSKAAISGEADLQTNSQYGNNSISGQYTFALSGVYVTGNPPVTVPSVIVGRFSADGNGVISEGEEDITGGLKACPAPADVFFTGSYSVGPNGWGEADLTDPCIGAWHFGFCIVSPREVFLFAESNTSPTNSVSGEMHPQASGPFAVNGSYAFSFAAVPSAAPVASGQLTSNGTGTVQSGTIDSSFVGMGQPLSGTYSTISPTGRGTMVVSAPSGNASFVFYANSSSAMVLSGSTNATIVLGSMEQQ